MKQVLGISAYWSEGIWRKSGAFPVVSGDCLITLLVLFIAALGEAWATHASTSQARRPIDRQSGQSDFLISQAVLTAIAGSIRRVAGVQDVGMLGTANANFIRRAAGTAQGGLDALNPALSRTPSFSPAVEHQVGG